MRVRWRVTMIAIAMCCAGVAQAADPTGAELIAKYLEASGGADKMAAVKSRIDTGTLMLTDMGMEAAYTSTTTPPNSLMELDFDGTIVINGITNGVSWSLNEFTGNTSDEGKYAAEIFPFLALAEAGDTAKCTGEEEVEGAACYKVEVADPEGGMLTVWCDKKTGLIAKSVQKDDAAEVTSTFSDYKEVDGLTVAHAIAQTGGEFAVEITLTKVEMNADVADDKFDIPDEVKSE